MTATEGIVQQRLVVAYGGTLSAYTALTAVLAGLAFPGLRTWQAPGPVAADDVLAPAAALAAEVVLTWLTATVLLALAASSGTASEGVTRLSGRLHSGLARRVVAVALGAGLASSSGATVASAEDLPARPAVRASTAVVPTLDRLVDVLPGWTPDRPAHRPASDLRPHLGTGTVVRGRTVDDEVVVRRGDTLWDIAARHLGPDATDAEVAAEWPRWHHANRDVVGPVPDHILPGQRLRPPAE